MLVLAAPYRGRAIPFSFVSYSSQTIAQQSCLCNLEHNRALGEVAERIGDTPVVLDREFSYGRLLEAFEGEGMKFVIRLNTGTRPTFTDREGREVELSLTLGQRVNGAGEWRRGLQEPLWVMTNLEPAGAHED